MQKEEGENARGSPFNKSLAGKYATKKHHHKI
jgi:hypothetical protein